MEFNERFVDANIAELCQEYDSRCGANKNLSRVIPTFIDALKPVQRRILYSMFLKDHGKKARKVIAITGDVSKLHVHGPSSAYAALVNLAQTWNNNIPLIKGEGNFGTVGGDPAAADRYIKASISEFAYTCYFEDWKESAVDMIISSADEESTEPLYLPAKYPVILLNGCLGIGYGQSTNIAVYNFSEVVHTTIALMRNPDAKINLIPDSPTGCDIVESPYFKSINERGTGSYSMRCKYEIESDTNGKCSLCRITALPYLCKVNQVTEEIAKIKQAGGLVELIGMEDHTVEEVNLLLKIRNDVNPYKFMRRLIKSIPGLERSYMVNITVIDDFESYDYSIRTVLLEWIRYRREQKQVVLNNKRTAIIAEQRANDVKLFISRPEHFDAITKIFKEGKNTKEIEQRLVDRYRNSEIKMDSLQAKTLSGMRLGEFNAEAHQKYLEKVEQLAIELAEVESYLDTHDGIDRCIVDELKDGVKRFGSPRKSSVVPKEISIDTDVEGECILQLSSEGMIIRKPVANVGEEPIPLDAGGFAAIVHNDSSFVIVDDTGNTSFVMVKELPVDTEVPIHRFVKGKLGKIVAMLPHDIDSPRCCILISRNGVMKKFKISEMRPTKKPCIDIDKDDAVVRGIVCNDVYTPKDILIYTKDGYGQRVDPNEIRLTSFISKGIKQFKVNPDDFIQGCYLIDASNTYLLYFTARGKARLNKSIYLPNRDSKHDKMVRLITLGERDKLAAVVGCNRKDSVEVFYTDGTSETVPVKNIKEGTMSSEPRKITQKNAVSNTILKVKLL